MRKSPSGLFRFGSFELDPRTQELRCEQKLVPLQFQPFKLLHYLLEHAGDVVTRQELKEHLWGDQTFVDFEAGLNFSIRRIRRALGESARSPALLQTYNRRGYRFLGRVEWVSNLPEILPIRNPDPVTRLAEQIAHMLIAACRRDSLLQDRFESIALAAQNLPDIHVLLHPTGQELSLVLHAKG